MAKKKKELSVGGIGEWVVTYGDMVTLLLCFFVALFNASDADVVQTEMLISSLNNVKAARVHLAIPKGSVFVRDERKPTASVFLTLMSGSDLSDTQVDAIEERA